MVIKSPRPTGYTILLLLVSAAAISLLLFQYFFNRSLWIDEAMLTHSIIDRGYIGLLKPLGYSQVAPVLFIWIEKLSTQLFGNGEKALRLFPLISAILSLALIYRLALVLTGNRIIALMALLMLALSPRFIYYGSEVKQYSTDIMVLLALYCTFFVDHPFMQKHRILLLSIAGCLGIFLSNVAVIGLATLGLFILYRLYAEKRAALGLLIPAGVWMVCFIGYYLLFIYHHPSTDYMKAFWKFAFIPLDSFEGTLKWIDYRGKRIAEQLLYVPGTNQYYATGIIVSAASLIIMAIRKNYRLLFLCVTPLLIHVGLSALGQYPFDGRLVLYQAPLCVLVICYFFYQVSLLLRKFPALQYLLLLLLMVDKAWQLKGRLPMRNEEIRPVIESLNKVIQPDQTVYLYYGSQAAFKYYQKTGVVQFGHAKIINGGLHPGDVQAFEREIQALKGQVWIIHTRFLHRQDDPIISKALQERAY